MFGSLAAAPAGSTLISKIRMSTSSGLVFRGMRWEHFDVFFESKLKSSPPPSYLLVQIGSNNLGANIKSGTFSTILRCKVPHMTIIWSDMWPRLYWHNAKSARNIDSARKDVNRKVKQYLKTQGILAITQSYSFSPTKLSQRALKPSFCPHRDCQCFLMIVKSSHPVLITYCFFLPGGTFIITNVQTSSFGGIRGFPQMKIAPMSGSKRWVFHAQYWGGGGYWVTSVYPEDRLDPCCTKVKFWGPTPGSVIPTLYQGRQERVRAWATVLSPFHICYSRLAPRGLSLATVTCRSASAPGQWKVIFSGS